MKHTTDTRRPARRSRAARHSDSESTLPPALAPCGHNPPSIAISDPAPKRGTPRRDAGSGGDAYRLYFREIGSIPLLTPDEQAELVRRMCAGDQAARERLIKSLLRLVVKIAHSFDGLGVPLLDLISEGNIGLMKAVDRLKPERAASLVVYASIWIKQSIRLALANDSRTVRLPANVHAKLLQIRRLSARLHEELGREPNEEEIGDALGLPPARVRRWLDAGQGTVHLDQPLKERENHSVGSLIADPNATTADESLAHAQTLRSLSRCVAELDHRSQRILQSRFGLDGQRERTLCQISTEFGVTRERIRQLQNAALLRLRRSLADREITQPTT